jgi:chorismate mutase
VTAQAEGAAEARARLAELRERILEVDRELIRLVAERVRMAREVGVAKRAAGLPTLDPEREAVILRRAAEMAREAGLPEEMVRDVFWHLIGLSRRAQNEVAEP